MIYLIYASTAVRDMTQDELLELLAQAREKNHRLGITGMLLYRNRNFLQVLEGESAAVDTLFETIKRDPRHRHIDLILRRPIPCRSFSEWEMGFINLNQTQIDVPGYSDFLTADLRPLDDTAAYIFLKNFRDYMR